METALLTESNTGKVLLKLLSACRHFDVAVAWAGENFVVDAMLDHHHKMRHVLVGTHLYQTNPAVLRRLMKLKAARCLPPTGRRLFHPKVYLFDMPDGMAAIVGSHNLTSGAFDCRNIEVSVLLKGLHADAALDELADFVHEIWRRAQLIDEDFLFSYEAQYKANRAKRQILEQFHYLRKPKPGSQRLSPISLTWDSFVNKVKDDGHHKLDGRLKILERAATLFRERPSFARMHIEERYAIAGIFGRRQDTLDGLDWAWFGSMVGQGDFRNLVIESPEGLSAALDHIPLIGDVDEHDYVAFVKTFEKAFKDKQHRGGIGTGSRLLCMKRPDFFVGVNNPNRRGLCDAVGSAPTTLNLRNYWERIVIPIHLGPWWQVPRPREALPARIWDNRAALLDSIYYDPDTDE
jgi:HKD family nuclease